jgi:hypothetical protein
LATYLVGATYFGGIVNGIVGHGNENLSGASGSYGTYGYGLDAYLGRTFTLFDSRKTLRSSIPTKAPPRREDGYALQFDLRGHLAYADNRVDGFTDSTGFVWGTEDVHFWTAGAEARLTWLVPSTTLTWTPFVAATFDQEFGFSHKLDIPLQPGQAADTVTYTGAQTFWGGRAGIAAQFNSGWNVGVQGGYQESNEFRIASAQAFLRYYFAPGSEPGLMRNFTLPQQR